MKALVILVACAARGIFAGNATGAVTDPQLFHTVRLVDGNPLTVRFLEASSATPDESAGDGPPDSRRWKRVTQRDAGSRASVARRPRTSL